MNAPPPSSPPRHLLPLALAGLAAVLIVVAVVSLAAPHWLRATDQGPTLGGPFTLVDGKGHTVTDANFRGRLMMMYFGYTFCPDVCPTTLATIGCALDKLTKQERAQVAPLFITVDPARDTPATMGAYVANFAPDLVGLTGSPQQIAAVLREYRVYAEKVPGKGANDYTMDHSSIIYFVGRDGRFRGIIAANATVPELDDAIRKYL